jgi:hypothetical protein
VSLSVIGLLASPMAQLLFVIPDFVSCLGCLERIQGFTHESEQAAAQRTAAWETTPSPTKIAPSPMVTSRFRHSRPPMIRSIGNAWSQLELLHLHWHLAVRQLYGT